MKILKYVLSSLIVVSAAAKQLKSGCCSNATEIFSIQKISHTISGAQLKKASYLNPINFDSGNYLNMWVTFDVFTCNRMIKLKMASKRSELDCNN